MIKNIFQYSFVLFKFWFLLKQCHADVFIDPEITFVCCFFSGENFKERAFAETIACNNSDFITFRNIKGNVFKQWLSPKTFCQSFSRHVVHDAKLLCSLWFVVYCCGSFYL